MEGLERKQGRKLEEQGLLGPWLIRHSSGARTYKVYALLGSAKGNSLRGEELFP